MTVTARPPPSVKVAFGLALVVSILAIAIGTALYQWHFQQERREAAQMLSAIADLKVRQVSGWLVERVGDANAVAANPGNVQAVSACLASKSGCDALTGVLTAMMSSYGYHGASIVATDGTVLASVGQRYILHSDDQVALSRISAGGGARLSDLHVNERGVVELEVIAPLVDDGQVLAAVFLVIDAERALFPLVTSWPMPSNSGESMLLRTEGRDVQIGRAHV